MAKNYKVKTIAILVRGNRMAKHGEVLSAAMFMSDPEELVKNGFLEETKDTPATEEVEKEVVKKESKPKK